MKLTEIKANPNNPRVIKDAAFEKLCKSIQEFPKMLSLRPMVVDADNVVLGGNMRLKALQHLGYKEIPDAWVVKASELTTDEQRRFIIADNVSGGDWDIEDLSENWDRQELEDWGLELPDWSAGHEANNMTDEDVNLLEEFDPIGVTGDNQRVVFIFDNSDDAQTWLENNKINAEKKGQAWQVNMTSQSI